MTGSRSPGYDLRMSSRKGSLPLVMLEDVVLARERRLLRGVSWQLCEGELWAVVGPNGAGKTTLLRVLGGELPVSTGEVCYSFRGRSGARGRRRTEADPHDQILQVSFDGQERLLQGAAGYAQSCWHALEDAAVSSGREVLGAPWRTARGRRLVQALRPCAVAGLSCDRALQR